FHADDGIRAFHVTGVQTCALPILPVVSFERVVQLVGDYQPYKGFGIERSLTISPAYWIRSASRRSVILTVVPAIVLYFWLGNLRSEERRVGREGRTRRWAVG